MAEPKIVVFSFSGFKSNDFVNFFIRITKDKYKKSIANALDNTDIKFTIRAIFSSPPANKEKKAPII